MICANRSTTRMGYQVIQVEPSLKLRNLRYGTTRGYQRYENRPSTRIVQVKGDSMLTRIALRPPLSRCPM